MSFRDACIPVRLGWSSPFARWQGPLAEVSSLDLAAQVTTGALARSGLPAAEVAQACDNMAPVACGAPIRAATVEAP